jgi:hypothetical protein
MYVYLSSPLAVKGRCDVNGPRAGARRLDKVF